MQKTHRTSIQQRWPLTWSRSLILTGERRTMAQPGSPPNDIASTAGLLAGPGQVVEVRALADNAVHSGYFSDYAALARSVAPLDADPAVHGIYITLNRVNPSLLSRRANRIKMRLSPVGRDHRRCRHHPAVLVPHRHRPGPAQRGIEHGRTGMPLPSRWRRISRHGSPASVSRSPSSRTPATGHTCCTGSNLPNDPVSTTLMKRGLAVLDTLFSNATATVDTANYNAGRIWKLYGTVSRKGDDTPERPHRRSRILTVPDRLETVTAGLLGQLGRSLPPGTQSPSKSPVEVKGYMNILDLSDWLHEHNIAIKSEKPYQNGRIYLLESCPFSAAHKDGAYAIQFANGAIHARLPPPVLRRREAAVTGAETAVRDTRRTPAAAGGPDPFLEPGPGGGKSRTGLHDTPGEGSSKRGRGPVLPGYRHGAGRVCPHRCRECRAAHRALRRHNPVLCDILGMVPLAGETAGHGTMRAGCSSSRPRSPARSTAKPPLPRLPTGPGRSHGGRSSPRACMQGKR